jgi:hypothetical protein
MSRRDESEAVGKNSLKERLGWLQIVVELNPDLAFLELDYSPHSAALEAVDFGALPAAARHLVIRDLSALSAISRSTRRQS